jgi:DNA-binding CsgD family transcriptional regulator
MRPLDLLDRMPKPLVAACSLLLIAGLAVLDYGTGSRAWIEAFYLAPVALSAWCVGRWTGVGTTCVAAGAATAADMLPRFQSSSLAVPLLNGAALLGVYLAFSLLPSDLRGAHKDLEAKARLRAEALLAEMEQHRHTQRSLRDRELEVFALIGQGLGTRQIADRLGVGVKAVETYREHIKAKLCLKNAGDLTHHAYVWVESRSKP